MSDQEDLAVAAVVVIIGIVKSQQVRRRRPRRFWVRPSLVRGREKYSTDEFMKDLLLYEVDELNLEYGCNLGFRNFFRMKNSDYEHLLSMIAPKIVKKDTSFIQAICASQRLAVTLRFLAFGDSYTSLVYLLMISKQAISYIVPEVCDALIEALQDYVKVPRNVEEWERIAKLFNDKWNYPNCVGAIDGKHINVQAPENSVVGCQGRISDGGVFNNTFFKKCLDDNTIHLPSSRPLPQLSLPIPYVFVGDEAFQLTPNLMKPFSGYHNKRTSKRIFNYRLSRARRVSENAFGIMSSTFHIFRKPILLNPDVATKVTLAAIYLHNYLRNSGSRNVYCSVGMLDSESPNSGKVVPGLWRDDPLTSQINNLPTIPKRSCIEAQTVRKELAKFLSLR